VASGTERKLAPAGIVNGQVKKLGRLLLAGLAWLIVLAVVADLARHHGRYGWDFRVYYDAAIAIGRGLDVYDPSVRAEIAGFRSPLGFAYPPVTAHLFRPFTLMAYPFAYLAWLALKLAALAALVLVWRRLVPLDAGAGTVLFGLLAFAGAIHQDLLTGNVSLFEQLLLWSGVLALVRGHDVAFAILVAVAAQLKLTPIAFLAVLPFARRPVRLTPLLVGAATFAALLATNALEPAQLERYLAQSPPLHERGRLNPSGLALARDVTDAFAEEGARLPAGAAEAVYGAIVALVAGAALAALLRHRRRPAGPDVVRVSLLAAAVYAVTLPRLKPYAAIVLLPPTLFVLGRARERVLVPLAAVLALLPLRDSLLPFATHFRLVLIYLPWIAGTVVVWALVRELWDEPLSGVERSRTPAGPAA